MQDGPKAVWSIPYVFVAFFPSLKQNCIAYRSSKVSSRPDCNFEIQQVWKSGCIRVYSNSFCSCLFEAEIIKIGQSSYNMYSNNILNFQESTTILNASTKRFGNLLKPFNRQKSGARQQVKKLIFLLVKGWVPKRLICTLVLHGKWRRKRASSSTGVWYQKMVDLPSRKCHMTNGLMIHISSIQNYQKVTPLCFVPQKCKRESENDCEILLIFSNPFGKYMNIPFPSSYELNNNPNVLFLVWLWH